MSITKRIAGALALPAAMYLIMMALCYSHGKMYYGTWTMWRSLLVDIGISATCAFGIGLQFKGGRFDFSGGAIMLLAAIIAGNAAVENGNNILVFILLCFGVSMICSLLVAAVYIYGRMPIVIVTIGMTLLYEAVSCLIYNGAGINITGVASLKVFSQFPLVLVPLLMSVMISVFYSYFTTTGKRAVLLANGQSVAVSIGIQEKRNVFTSYIYSGLLFGLASLIYASTKSLTGAFSSLQTVGELFSNILPVFIGLALIPFCGDTIGMIVGALTLCLMSFGLKASFTAEFGASLAIAMTGVFMFVFSVVTAQGKNIGRRLLQSFGGKKPGAHKE